MLVCAEKGTKLIIKTLQIIHHLHTQTTHLLSVGELRTSSNQTAFANPFNNFKRYGKILSRCCNFDSRKYIPRAITASCPLWSRRNTPCAVSCGHNANSVFTYNKKEKEIKILIDLNSVILLLENDAVQRLFWNCVFIGPQQRATPFKRMNHCNCYCNS